ncbi:MAG: phospholipase D-like domain-containing protein [Hormoscilla sp.]
MNSQKSTYLTPEELKRYDDRPGFDLVGSREVGLPVYKVTLQAITQIRKPIPPIEEYVLKAMDAGLNSEADIGGFLGLEQEILKEAMINLRMSEDIDLIAPEGSSMQVWQLTKKGKKTLEDAQTIVPEERTFDLNFDGLVRKARWYGKWENSLLKPRDLRQREIIEIDPSPNKRPELPDIKLQDVDEIISKLERKKRRKQEQQEQDLLALKAIERRLRFFQPALALTYKAKESDEVQVAFAIDGILSPEHEACFVGSNSLKKLKIYESLKESEPSKLAQKAFGSELITQARLQAADKLKEKFDSARSELYTSQEQLEEAEDDREKAELRQTISELEQNIESFKKQLEQMTVRFLEVYDHPQQLQNAIRDSQERLMIISPWIRANVVDKIFLQAFEKMLKRGVEVFIGYGLGDGKDKKRSQADIKAENNLKNLDSKYNNFWLKRLGNTHAKILICDSKFAVTTSFNWLSFQGDPDRTFRDERGTLVSIPKKIDELFASYRKEFD